MMTVDSKARLMAVMRRSSGVSGLAVDTDIHANNTMIRNIVLFIVPPFSSQFVPITHLSVRKF